MVMQGRYYYSLVPWLLCGGEKRVVHTKCTMETEK